jgi:hypothetical protein
MKATVSCVAMASSKGGPTAVDGLNQSQTLICKAMRHGQRNVKTPHAGSQACTPAGCALARLAVFAPSAHPQMPSRGRRPSAIVHAVDHASTMKRRDPRRSQIVRITHGEKLRAAGMHLLHGDSSIQAMEHAVACDALLTRYSEIRCSGMSCATVSQLYTFPSISAQPDVRTSM